MGIVYIIHHRFLGLQSSHLVTDKILENALVIREPCSAKVT